MPACPICGDPRAYPLWVDAESPTVCPHDASVTSVSECGYQRKRAWQAAELRRLAPECFDGNGNALPGRIYEALLAFNARHPRHAWAL